MDEAVFVDLYHVPGVIPAGTEEGCRWLQLAGMLDPVIPTHHIRTGYVQETTVIDAGYRYDLMPDAGQQLAHGAAAIGHRRVYRQHGRSLGRAIAFQHTDAEFLEPEFPDWGGELFCACHHVAQAVKVIRMSEPGVMPKESAGAEQD